MPVPVPPRLDDVHAVMRFAFGVLGEADGLDELLATLQITSGVTPRDGIVTTPAGRAAARFVLDALTDTLVERLRVDLERH
ncbi:MAG TPA: hypothetical protein VFG42_11405 [Baekduia sp.]|uniref:hypothetical protein n=1 Tax=Baekduia sp. TaxID=2600305 RepID=UPI002D781373|nr:hypothetical protein [Baekduia sp.]HET6507384.1 hypothetical protein [Baekduia sp.]